MVYYGPYVWTAAVPAHHPSPPSTGVHHPPRPAPRGAGADRTGRQVQAADVVRYARASRRFPKISIPSCPTDNVDRMVLPKEAGGNAGNTPPRTAASGRVGGCGGHHLASTTAAWAARGIRGIHGDCSARQPGASAGPRRVAERARRDPADVPSRALARGGLRGTIRLLSVTDEGHRASEHDQRLVCSTHHCTKLSSSMEPCWCGSSRRMAAMCTRSSSGA